MMMVWQCALACTCFFVRRQEKKCPECGWRNLGYALRPTAVAHAPCSHSHARPPLLLPQHPSWRSLSRHLIQARGLQRGPLVCAALQHASRFRERAANNTTDVGWGWLSPDSCQHIERATQACTSSRHLLRRYLAQARQPRRARARRHRIVTHGIDVASRRVSGTLTQLHCT